MEKLQELKALVEGCDRDAYKFLRGNFKAGTRLRKQMQVIKNKANEIRQEVMDSRGKE